eukprot:5579416-Prymnesium_polylepis.1
MVLSAPPDSSFTKPRETAILGVGRHAILGSGVRTHEEARAEVITGQSGGNQNFVSDDVDDSAFT